MILKIIINNKTMNKITLDTPKVVVKTITYTEFAIKDIKVNLNQKAKFIVILYGDETDVVEFEMTEQEYSVWGTDDTYVIDFIKQKLIEYNPITYNPVNNVIREGLNTV